MDKGIGVAVLGVLLAGAIATPAGAAAPTFAPEITRMLTDGATVAPKAVRTADYTGDRVDISRC
jgi:hypothetical protein